MGMFDTFVLNHDVICPGCGEGIRNDFQTKELDCGMYTFYQGGPAAIYKYRGETEEEEKEKLSKMREEHPEWFHEDGKLRGRFSLMRMSGMIKRTDEIIRFIPDGTYRTYTYCNKCQDMVYADMVVSSGIFLGVAGKDDSLKERITAKFKRRQYKISKADIEENGKPRLKI